MKYEKPEVTLLGAASAVIQSASLIKGTTETEKACSGGSPHDLTDCAAYQADE
jgi:hypothetical protein